MDTHLKLHATQLKHLTQTQTHPLHDLNAYLNLPKNMKATIFYNNEHTNIIISKPDIAPEEYRENLIHIHTIPSPHNTSVLEKAIKLLTPHPMTFIYQNKTLTHHMCTKLAQLRANKSPLLQSYLHTVNPETYMPQCPLCLSPTHDTNHHCNCSQLPTQHNTTSLWKKPLEATEVIQ